MIALSLESGNASWSFQVLPEYATRLSCATPQVLERGGMCWAGYHYDRIPSCNWKKACGRLTWIVHFIFGGVGYEV